MAPCNDLVAVPISSAIHVSMEVRSRQEQQNQWFNPAAFEAPFGSDPAILNAPDPSVLMSGGGSAIWACVILRSVPRILEPRCVSFERLPFR